MRLLRLREEIALRCQVVQALAASLALYGDENPPERAMDELALQDERLSKDLQQERELEAEARKEKL